MAEAAGAQVSAVPGSGEQQRYTVTDVIAGLLAAGSLTLSFIAIGFGLILQVEPRPARLVPVALILALVSVAAFTLLSAISEFPAQAFSDVNADF